MKQIIVLLVCLTPLLMKAQEPQIIGGYLLNGNDSFEELDAAVLTESRSKDKKLDGNGMLLPGVVVVMTPNNVGKEIGTVVKVKHPFLVKNICFTVDENRIEGCKANIRIYRKTGDNNLENIVTMPIYQEIPKTEKKTTFKIAPQESLELQPGEYYICFALNEISKAIEDKWADFKTWTDKERYKNQLEDSIFFPTYIKSSYSRENSEKPLMKWKYNIGIKVIGKIQK